MRVRVESDDSASVFYDLDRGLPAESFGIPFGHVCAGVFLESLAVVAASAGYTVRDELRSTLAAPTAGRTTTEPWRRAILRRYDRLPRRADKRSRSQRIPPLSP